MRKLCWAAVSCSAAIFLAVYLLPEVWLLPAGVLCALASLCALLFRGNTRRRVALAALGAAAGLLWTSCYSHIFVAPARALISDEPQTYILTVSDFPSENSWGCTFPARLSLKGSRDPLVQVYAEPDAMSLRPGDTIAASLRLARSDFLRGESFDYYQSKGIYLLGYAQEEITLSHRPEAPPILTWPQYAARALRDSLERSFPRDVSGFLTALVTGDKSDMPVGLYIAFQRSGIAHVVAVSGLHISFLASLLALLLGRRNKLGTAVTLLAIFFFAALAGNSPSALRASFMCALLYLAPLVGREDDRPTTLAAVLALLLLQCPYASASVSLQLSFAAMAGIYLITGPLNSKWAKAIPKWTSRPGRLLRKVLFFCVGTLATTLGALLFTLPLAALHFHSVSLAGPVTNLLTLWAVSVAFLGGLLTALVGLFLPGPAALLGWLTAWPARWVILIARAISRLPFAAIPLRSEYLAIWFTVSYAIFLLWLLSKPRPRPFIPAAALLLCLCPALLVNAWPILSSSLTVTALDVGQGSSTLFYSQGHAVLVDCGGNSGDDAGDIAADLLQSLGSSRLDALILTHCHTDHANGVPELLTRVEVSRIILPEVGTEDLLGREILSLAEEYNCEVDILSRDTSISYGGAAYQLFAPLGDGGANEEGLSVLCTVDDFDVLVTGDMNDIVERRLVKYKDLPDIELLMVGHHGSKNSTSEELLLAVTPEYAVISSGYNTYGHPAPETLERLGAAGCDIYLTHDMGTITFTYNKEAQTP